MFFVSAERKTGIFFPNKIATLTNILVLLKIIFISPPSASDINALLLYENRFNLLQQLLLDRVRDEGARLGRHLLHQRVTVDRVLLLDGFPAQQPDLVVPAARVQPDPEQVL